MRLIDYLKDRIGAILLNIAGIYALSLFLLMLQNQKSAVILIDIAWLIVLISAMGVDFYRKKKYFDKVEDIIDKLDRPYLLSEVSPVGPHIEDRIYHELLRRSNKSVIEAVRKLEDEQSDYRDYLESWVHEIKTPITSMMLQCEQMDNASIPMKVALKRIENQVDMVLYYARMEHANRDYLIHPYDLQKIVSDAIQMNRVYLREQQAQIAVDMEETIISTDEKWVGFILTQFLINSIKYRSEEPLYIRFWCERRAQKVVLFVEDHGIGIAQEEITKIFEKGYTGTNGRIRQHSTGMGLYLCKQLCDKLGIGISCESQLNRYTRMILVFPDSSFCTGVEPYKNVSFP
ncbi:MAG: sensor histidine kinase [bacterium]|nr:sensor histidine kinase [bacterium]